jgi:hypothetical protein
MVLTALAAGVSLKAKPTPSDERTAPKIVPAPPLAKGWSYVKGEWIHADGYKYVNGKVIRTGAQTHKRPPRPPSKALLNSMIRSTPAPVPGSAAAKDAERERNLRPRPASQTGTHL